MSPFWDRRIKNKKSGLIIEKVAYSFLYLFSIALFYLIWDMYVIKDTNKFILYTAAYLTFLIVFYLVIDDIYSNYNFFKRTKNSEGIALLEESHFLCANPMCSRCGGWYWGLGVSFTILLALKDSIILTINNYNIPAYYFIIAGILAFVITTPFHGTLNFLNKKEISNNKIKLLFGFISGISIFIIVIGILKLIS